MILTKENIVHYLTDKELIPTESVVNGDFMVVDMTRRNRNFKIIRHMDKGLFVKQPKKFDAQPINFLSREASSYQLAKTDPAFRAIAGLMPSTVHFDAARSILVLDLIPESENLSEMHLRLGEFPLHIASSLGRSLGMYHSEIGRAMGQVRETKIFPEMLPWTLSINKEYIQQMKMVDELHLQFYSIIDKYPEFLGSIAQLRAGWEINSLVHGDMKWDNCMVYKDTVGLSEQWVLKIVDWELADLGDSAWDVGAVFQTFLSLWVMSKHSIESMQPAIRCFWEAYTGTMGIEQKEQARLLTKCIGYAAVRIIQTGYENMYYTKQITNTSIYLLQLSLNIIKDPGEAIGVLLGL